MHGHPLLRLLTVFKNDRFCKQITRFELSKNEKRLFLKTIVLKRLFFKTIFSKKNLKFVSGRQGYKCCFKCFLYQDSRQIT